LRNLSIYFSDFAASINMFTVGISSWNMFFTSLMIFGIKEKSIILTHTMYYWLLPHIPVRHVTGFVVQGHILLLKVTFPNTGTMVILLGHETALLSLQICLALVFCLCHPKADSAQFLMKASLTTLSIRVP